MTGTANASAGRPPWRVSLGFGAIASGIAAMAAITSLHLDFLPWAMFVGWVAYFSRPISARQGLCSWLCLVCGLTLGVFATLALAELTPAMGSLALAVVVFVVAMIVLSMRVITMLDNSLAWFLGLIAVFAAHAAPSVTAIAELAGAGGLGSVAAWVAQRLQRRLMAAV